MSGAIHPGAVEVHSNKPGKTIRERAWRFTNSVKTKFRSSFSRRRSSSEDSKSPTMSRMLSSSKTATAGNQSPKGPSGSPFKTNVNEVSSSVHSSEASFRGQSLLTSNVDSTSDAAFFPNKIASVSGLDSILDMSDPTRVFADPTGAVVKPDDASDLLESPTTMTSPAQSDTTPKTNQSQIGATLKTDQCQQDLSSRLNVNPDASGNVTNDSNVPIQVPDVRSTSNQGSDDPTKDDGTPVNDRTPLKIGDFSGHAWDAKKRQERCIQWARHVLSASSAN